MSDRRFDVAVVGGGLVGLASAYALARPAAGRPPRRVVVLEGEPRLTPHQSGHNSGVIHSGLYYKPGSLKAATCTAGRQALYEFCARHEVPHARCGKLVVATAPEELARLDELERRGRANGLVGLRRLGPEELREKEPEVAGIAGLWVEETGIVDYPAVGRALAREIEAAGGEVHTSARVERVREEPGGLVLENAAGVVSAGFLVACCGLWADRFARLAGVDPGVRIVPFRGEYLELVPDRRHLVRGLIYPTPDPDLPFLGVHLTRGIDGLVEAGPNAVLALARAGYRWRDVSLADAWDTLTYPGFYRFARRFLATGIGEVRRSLDHGAALKALQRLMPSLRREDLRPGGSGVRAQALDRQGRLLDDFHLVRAPRMIHVLNAPSPAATAALAIGETIAAQVG